MILIAATLLASPFAAAPAVFQSGEPAPATAEAGAKAAANEALETLRAAVQAQLTEPFRGRVRGFAIDLNLRERDQGKREVDLQLYYRADEGGMVRLVLDDPELGTRIQKGFDGQDYWLLEEDKPVQILSGKDFENDRTAINDLFSMSERLMLLLDLGRLEDQLRGELSMDRDTTAIRLAGRLEVERSERLFVLELDPITQLPVALHLELPRAADAAADAPMREQVFRLGAFRDADGRIFPQQVAEYRPAPERDPELWVRAIEIRDLLWRTPPSKASFAPRDG